MSTSYQSVNVLAVANMSRPLYESSDDLKNEQEVAVLMQSLWDCKFTKMPIKYHLDYVMHRGYKAVGFCEVKTRNYTMESIDGMGGYLMSIGKWSSAKQLNDVSGLPFILVVRALDGIYYAVFKELHKPPIEVKGRKDRNDWQDIEPCVVLETKLFKKLEKETV